MNFGGNYTKHCSICFTYGGVCVQMLMQIIACWQKKRLVVPRASTTFSKGSEESEYHDACGY